MRSTIIYALFLMLAAPLLAGAPPKRTPAVRQNPSPASTPVPVVRGWQDLTWGMTSAQVVTLHPEARRNPYAASLLTWKTTISGREFDVTAKFDADALRDVRLAHVGLPVYKSKPIPESPDPLANLKILQLNMADKLRELKSETVEAYTVLVAQVESGLREKYGEPTAGPPVPSSDKVRMTYFWSLPETWIGLFVTASRADDAVKLLGVEYRDAQKTQKPSTGL